jgi:hypothetical protein
VPVAPSAPIPLNLPNHPTALAPEPEDLDGIGEQVIRKVVTVRFVPGSAELRQCAFAYVTDFMVKHKDDPCAVNYGSTNPLGEHELAVR